MLSALFQDRDNILLMDSDINKFPFRVQLRNLDSIPDPAPAYYAINPIDGAINRNEAGKRSIRASINVSAYRNFLFEMDSIPLDEQLAVLKHIHTKISLAQVTYSGSASYHAIVSVADTLPFQPYTETGIAQYSQAWRALNAELTSIASQLLGAECPGQLFDPACKDPARLSRTPGAIRPDNGNEQSEMPNFGGYVSSDQILTLLRKYNFNEVSLSVPVPLDDSMDFDTLEAALLLPENKGLRSKLQKVDEWAAADNMYPAIFQLTLWIIDQTGAPLNTTVAYMRSKIFPNLRSANYPRNPEIPIYNAYSWKGLS